MIILSITFLVILSITIPYILFINRIINEMFLYTSINTLNLCGTSNYIQYICKYESLQFLYPVIILLRIYLSFVFILYRLSYIVKALFVGTICHTTDILNAVFCCVHWIKPPSFLFVLFK